MAQGGEGRGPAWQSSSTVGALVTIPIGQLSQAANSALPRQYSQGWTNGPDACIHVIGRVCAGTQYKFSVSRGDIAIAAAGRDALALSVDLAISGQGGFRGDGARLLSLQAKNFEAAARFTVIVTPRIAEDWCPSVDVRPSYTWTRNPKVEIVSGVDVDVSGQVGGMLDGQLPQIVQIARDSLKCEQIKPQLASLYGARTFPIDLTAGRKAFVNLQPRDFAFSGLQVDERSVRLAALLTAQIDVGPTPIAQTPLPLPPLKTIPAVTAPRMNVALPIRMPLRVLEEEANRMMAGKTFDQASGAGQVKVTVKRVSIYPTPEAKVAIGIDFGAKLPGRLLDTKGSVFLVGTPVAERGTWVRLKDPSFTRILDNEAWNVLSALFASQIRGALDQQLRYDFAGDIRSAKKALADKLADPAAIANAQLAVTDVDMGLGRFGLEGSDLVAEGLFGANVTIEPRGASLMAQR